MRDASESFQSSSTSAAVEPLNEQIAAAIQALEQVRSQFRMLVESPQVREAVQGFNAFTELLRQVDAETLKAVSEAMKAAENTILKAELLGEYGWTLPMMMTPFKLHQILALDTPSLIDTAFVEFYSSDEDLEYRRLRDYLLASPDLRRWRVLLRQCCDAYERHDYLIPVPSLLTVLEGAIATPSKARFVRGPDRARFFKDKIDGASADSVEQWMWRSVNAFVKALFQKSDFFDSAPPDRLNRHWILHGRDVLDWDASDCLRLFQAIGTVTKLD